MSPIADEQIVVAIVVVVADATPLPPSGTSQMGLFRDISERAVAVVVKQITDGSLILLRLLEAGSIHQKNVEPAIVVIIEQRHAATHLLQEVLLVGSAATNVLGTQQAGTGGYVGENDGKMRVNRVDAPNHGQHRHAGSAQHLQECTTGLRAAGAAIHACPRVWLEWRRDGLRFAASCRVRSFLYQGG